MKERMISLEARVDSAGKPVLFLQSQPIQVLAADGQTIDTAKLREALEPYVRGPDRKTEIALDARGITWGTVIAIQDAAKAAGVHTVHHVFKREASK
jgi:hypothetical protein